MTKEFKAKFEKGYYKNLLDWKGLETIINTRPLLTKWRVKLPIEEKEYTWPIDKWMTDPQTYPASVMKELIDTQTFYIVDASKFTKKLNDFCKKIEETYKKCCDAHIYICKNLKKDHPFGIHFDYCDNIIVQCEGTTNFKVWPSESIDPMGSNQKLTFVDDKEDPPLLDVLMKPGDAIWVPKHCPHQAISKTERFSISFPMDSFVFDNEQFYQGREWVSI